MTDAHPPAKAPICQVRIASKGPRFFRGEDGGVQFEIRLDSRSKIGPRPATELDADQYPAAWRAFAAGEEAAEPLTPQIEAVDIPAAKAAQAAERSERQRRMDARRGGGL